jgi:type IV fimbrial biogenesis protein FimT
MAAMRNAATHRRSRGFTLIELLVTVAVVAIALSLAAAGFREVIARNRMSTSVNGLIATLQLARSEAVTRGIETMLCPTPPGADPTDLDTLVCAARDAWETGYILFADADKSRDRTIASEPLIRAVGNNAEQGITITWDGGNDQVLFQEDGSSNSMGTFRFCGDADPRWVRLNIVGRAFATDTQPPGADACPP